MPLKEDVKPKAILLSRDALPDGYSLREPTGGRYEIAAGDGLWKEFKDDVNAEARTRIETTMEEYRSRGPRFPPSLFEFEGHHEGQGLKVRMEAFKGWGVRLYGFCATVAGLSTFIVTGSDFKKKTVKAKARALRAAGAEAVRIRKLLG